MKSNKRNLLLNIFIIMAFLGFASGALAASNQRPYVETSTVSNVNANSAVLHGYANGNGTEISVWFEYGTTPDLNKATYPEYGGGATNANGFLGGLTSNTIYYYRLVATSTYGVSYGNIISFTTGQKIFVNNTTTINQTNNNTTNRNSSNTNNSSTNNDDTNSSSNSNSSLSSSAISTGFSIIPHTFIGWLVWILIIIVAIILVRMLQKNEYHDRGI